MAFTDSIERWRSRPEILMAALGLASGILSAIAGMDLELAWLRPVAAVFFLDAGPVPVGFFFGAAVALSLWMTTRNVWTLPVLPVVVMYAWSAAIQVAIRLQRNADDDPHLIAASLLSGLVGSATVYWLAPEWSTTVGASGAIFGLMGALVVLAYKVRGNVQGLVTLLALNGVITVLGAQYISWQGHLGGLVGGVVLGAVMVYAPRKRRGTVQIAGCALVALAIVAAVVARTMALTG